MSTRMAPGICDFHITTRFRLFFTVSCIFRAIRDSTRVFNLVTLVRLSSFWEPSWPSSRRCTRNPASSLSKEHVQLIRRGPRPVSPESRHLDYSDYLGTHLRSRYETCTTRC